MLCYYPINNDYINYIIAANNALLFIDYLHLRPVRCNPVCYATARGATPSVNAGRNWRRASAVQNRVRSASLGRPNVKESKAGKQQKESEKIAKNIGDYGK